MRLWREQPVSYGPVETLTPSNVRTLPSSVGPVWLPLSRCSRHGRKAATWQHRKCARKSADSKRSLSPTKKADKVPAKPQSCEIRNTSVQLGRTDERNARRSSTGKFVAGPKVRGGNPAKNDTQQRKK